MATPGNVGLGARERLFVISFLGLFVVMFAFFVLLLEVSSWEMPLTAMLFAAVLFQLCLFIWYCYRDKLYADGSFSDSGTVVEVCDVCLQALALLGGSTLVYAFSEAHFVVEAGEWKPHLVFLGTAGIFLPLPVLLMHQRIIAADKMMEVRATEVVRDHLKELCTLKSVLCVLQFLGLCVPAMYHAQPTAVSVFLAVELAISYTLSPFMKWFLWQSEIGEPRLAESAPTYVAVGSVLDVVLGISGMICAFSVEYESFANEFARSMLLLEHGLFLFFVGVRTLQFLFVPSQMEAFLLYIDAITRRGFRDYADTEWRYSLASYPATCLSIPPLLHFSIIAVPSTIAVAFTALSDQTCSDLARMVFVDLVLGIVGMVVGLRSFALESSSMSQEQHTVRQVVWNATYLTGVTVYRFTFTVNLAEVCEGIHYDSGSPASGVLLVATLSNAAYWCVLTACGVHACYTFTTDAIEGRLWGYLGKLAYVGSTASLLACKQINRLFTAWMWFFSLATPLEVVALAMCRHDGDTASCPDESVVVHGLTIALGVLVPVLGVLAVGSIRLWRPRFCMCIETPLFVGVWHLFMVVQLLSMVLELSLGRVSVNWELVFFVLQVVRFPLWAFDTYRSVTSSKAIVRMSRVAMRTHQLASGTTVATEHTLAFAPVPLGGSPLSAPAPEPSNVSAPAAVTMAEYEPGVAEVPPRPGFVQRQLSGGGVAWVSARDVVERVESKTEDTEGADEGEAKVDGEQRTGFVRRLNPNGTIEWIPADCVLPGSVEQASATGQAGQMQVAGWESYPLRVLAQVAQLSFEDKVQWFRVRVDHAAVPWARGHSRITLPRARLLERAVTAFESKSADELRQIWRFSFEGEVGMDAGGLAREFFELTAELLFERSGIFKHSATDNVTYQLNSNAQRAMPDREWRGLCRFAGTFMGKALFDRQIVKAHLARPFYKHLLGLPVGLSDMEFIDSMVYQSLTMILQYPEEQLEDLYLPFVVTEEDVFGVRETPLKSGGEDMVVNAANKSEYVQLLFEHTMLKSISPMLSEMLQGFYNVIPFHIVSVFNFQELELLMCGLEEIDMADWRANATYEGGYTAHHECVRWFWEVVSEFSHEDRARLLQYATGTSRVPVGGFARLQGRDGNIRRFTLQSVAVSASEYPRSHTCFNRIDLPRYNDKATMERALRGVIQISAGGGGGFTID